MPPFMSGQRPPAYAAAERMQPFWGQFAVRHYIEETARANLRKRLKEGAIQRAERDLHLAEE